MKPIAVFLGTALLATLAGCDLYRVEKVKPFDVGQLEGGNVTFSHVFRSIIRPKCVSCHSGVLAPRGVDLSGYDAIMNSSFGPDLVVPHDADASSLIASMESGEMPPSGKDPVSAVEIEAIKIWINGGAYRTAETGNDGGE